MKVLGIVQARMNSSRLPGKVLADIGGRTMLARVLRRASRANFIDELIVATPDQEILTENMDSEFKTFVGDEEDVLDRFYQAAELYRADAIVRICADNPLIDPWLIDLTILNFKRKKDLDYMGTNRFPLGLGVEVMTFKALEKAWQKTKNASKDYQRVHVTPYILGNPYQFKISYTESDNDLGHHRWTVDTQEDLDFMRSVYLRFGNSDSFSWKDVLDLVKAEPEHEQINAHIRQRGPREC